MILRTTNLRKAARFHIYETPNKTVRGLADYLVELISETITAKGKCTVAIPGGCSPKPLYELLASPLYRERIAWNDVFFFFTDERHVSFLSPDSNGRMVQKILLAPLRVPEKNIFYVDTSLSPESAAREYAKRIRTHFKGEPARFDLVLLGLGEDAHTASLSPHTQVLKERRAIVKAVCSEDSRPCRVTMTAPLINNAHVVAFLVYGAKKRTAVTAVLNREKDSDMYPAQLIHAESGVTRWFMDEKAAY